MGRRSSALLLSLPSLGLPIQMREGSERGALLQPPLGLLFLIPSYAPIPITAPSGSIAVYFSPSRTTPGRGAFSPPPSPSNSTLKQTPPQPRGKRGVPTTDQTILLTLQDLPPTAAFPS